MSLPTPISDHAGSLAALALRLPEAKRFVFARDARFPAGERRLDHQELATPLRGNFLTVPLPMEQLQDGERIGSLRVVASPGHTPGHICLVDERDDTLLAGDAYSTFAGVATSARTYFWFPLPGTGP